MDALKPETEWEQLYEGRQLVLLWRLSKGDRLCTASARKMVDRHELWLRQDQPDAPPHVRKLQFEAATECDRYIVAKLIELESEGWRQEVRS